MIKAGSLTSRIVVQRDASGAENSLGEKSSNWTDFISYRARREDVGDSERMAAGQVTGSLMSRFVIRSSVDSRTVNNKDRISHDGKLWEIHGVKRFRGNDRYIEITASAQID